MAALEKIRQKGPLLAIIIGFALFAFIFTGFFKNINTLFGDSQTAIAVINGEEASIDEFRDKFNKVKNVYEYLGNTVDNKLQEQIENQVWEQILQEKLLSEVYDDLGIDVSEDEMVAMVTGTNMDVDPTIKQIFTNRQTGVFDAEGAANFFRTQDQDRAKQQFASYLETEMDLNRKFAKYNALIKQGLNITTPEAEALYAERTHMVDFDYLVKKYTSVPDSSFSVSEKELKKYYNEHKSQYKQKESRDIAYVTFDIVPNEKDKADALNSIKDYLDDFKSIEADSANENIITYVNANSDVPFDRTYHSLNEMASLGLDSTFFFAEAGTVKGPYEFNGTYVISRITDRKSLPDTVQARHILIQPDGQVIKDIARAQEIADSLVNLLKGGADFAKLATDNSADQGSAQKGGDLGKFTQGRMVPEFDKACFFGKTNDIVTAETQFGVHIIEITYQSPKKEKVQIASLVKEIGNVDATDKLYQETQIFAGENNTLEKFEKAIAEKGLTKKIATDITPQTKVIAGFADASPIINWVFKKETKKGDVSQKDIKIGNQYVVVALTEVKEEGIAPFEQKKDEIKPIVIKEKKGKKFAEQLTVAGDKPYSEIAASVGGETSTAKNRSFTSSRIGGAGDEQAVVATAVSLDKGAKSKPVIGESGVFLLTVTSVTPAGEITPEKAANDKRNAQSRLASRSRFAYNAIKEAAEIKDNRHRFF